MTGRSKNRTAEVKKIKAKVKKKAKTRRRATNKERRKKGGRPPKYDVKLVTIAKRLCTKYGCNDSQLANDLDVTRAAICQWRKEHEEFDKAIEEGLRLHDSGQIEMSLRQKAKPHDDVTVIEQLRGRGKNRKLRIVEKRTRKKVVDTTAALKILAADDPKRFGNNVNLGGQEDSPVLMAPITVVKTYEKPKDDEPDTK